MQLVFSILVALFGLFSTYAQTLQPLFAGHFVWSLANAQVMLVETGILVSGIAGVFSSSGLQLPAWLSAIVVDIDLFIQYFKPTWKKTIAGTARVVTKTLIVLSFPVMLVCSLTAVSCAGTPCQQLANGIKAVQEGEVLAGVVCECISVDATAAAICKGVAEGLVITEGAAKDVYATYCSGSDAGLKLSPKLRTRADFDTYFAAQGAKKASR
jgi:hypothetical protein